MEFIHEGSMQTDSLLESDTDDSSESDSDSEAIVQPTSELLMGIITTLHSSRYLNSRIKIPKASQLLHMTLHIYKKEHPEIFRSYVRISPGTFDTLLKKIIDHRVFHNNSDNQQIPVEQQLAVTLYRFGHYGNAAGQQKVGLWAGWGEGTVDLCTRRVMAAICDDTFRKVVMKWPDEERKSKAKQWVEDHSCPAWRDGWCMVDGTLVPLFARPGFYGNSWFDRKSNYSLNVQVKVDFIFLFIIEIAQSLLLSQAYIDT